jgi:hypothetical protein
MTLPFSDERQKPAHEQELIEQAAPKFGGV